MEAEVKVSESYLVGASLQKVIPAPEESLEQLLQEVHR